MSTLQDTPGFELQLAPDLDEYRPLLATALAGLPPLQGKPIALSFLPALRAYRGKLLSAGVKGTGVHAAAFLRERRIVLEAGLLRNPRNLSRILVHELFHFVWLRLGNARRRSFGALLASEIRRRARGELGWSAEMRKTLLHPGDPITHPRRWREYVCESFCDSAARIYSNQRRHSEYSLARLFRERRRRWFRDTLAGGPIPI
jgi:hypothetical protein